MMRRLHRLSIVVLASLAVVGCNEEEPRESDRADARAPLVTLVEDPGQVCMAEDQLKGRRLYMVPIHGRPYYACSPECKERLETDAFLRGSTDPITRRPVDKSGALIGARQDGVVLYFEDKKSLEQLNSR